MKKKDLTLIVGVVIVSCIFSIVLSNVALGPYKKQVIKVPVVQKISSSFPSPQADSEYKSFFNEQAINPTQLIKIGDKSNTAPFNESQ
ncbi:hypothetical protein COU91_03805 [Candidatus Saccharibacteria bacterium CG10_big_fil_rev_8_21_14_0_10_47_8]|nr:MAG: hypothetical protein COU91_03805 [Candidatus Saccharibacteria bacterium CG10_big_fil_rev_8_21_14_0_10_47_8]